MLDLPVFINVTYSLSLSFSLSGREVQLQVVSMALDIPVNSAQVQSRSPGTAMLLLLVILCARGVTANESKATILLTCTASHVHFCSLVLVTVEGNNPKLN